MINSSFNQIQELKSIFAPSQLKILDIPNKNYKFLSMLRIICNSDINIRNELTLYKAYGVYARVC